MHHRQWRGALCRAAVACFAVLAAAPAAASATTTPPAPTLPTPPIVWGECPPMSDDPRYPEMDCGKVRVPLDYTNPGGRTIEIAVSRLKAADPAKRRGVLFTNPGGPGGAGLYLPGQLELADRLYADQGFDLLSQDLLDRYDIIGIDPRGVGRSAPVTCGMTLAEAQRAMVPLTEPGGFDATAAMVRGVAEQCDAHSGDLLPYITTANTARDLEQIRVALGERKVSYLGWSYGTYLGAVFASLYPNSTDRVVLDSNVNPHWVWRKQFRSWGTAGDPQLGGDPRLAPRWNAFAAWAAARDAQYHLGTTPAAVRATYFDLQRRVDANPLPGGIDGPMFRELVYSLLNSVFNEDEAEFLASMKAALEAPTGTAAKKVAEQAKAATASSAAADGWPEVPVDNQHASGLAVACDDVAWSRDPATYRRELLADIATFPMFGEVGSNIWPCAYWAHAPKEPLVPLSSLGPRNVLLLQNMRDPATPYAGGPAMRNALGQRSTLTVVDAGGHGASVLDFGANTCANRTMDRYLVTGALPPDGYCAAEPVPPKPEDPPAPAGQPAEQLRQSLTPALR